MEGMVQIAFTISEGDFSYSDALWLPADHTFTEEQIEAMKRERFDNWVAVITNPPPGPSNEELEASGVQIPTQQELVPPAEE